MAHAVVIERFGTIIANARYRARAYFALQGWLARYALGGFGRPILGSATATATSVLCQGLALAIVVGAVGQLQDSGDLVAFPGVDKLGIELPAPPPGVVIGAFVVIFVIGSALAFVGRHTAIRLESDMYRDIYHRLTGFFSQRTESSTLLFRTLWQRRVIARRYSLLRVLTSDARFAGVITRLALFNITHIGNITVGLLIIALYAPVLLPVIALFAVFAAFVMYPLNLRAMQSTRLLEQEAARRSRVIRDRIGFLLGNQGSAPPPLEDPDLALEIDDGNEPGNATGDNEDEDDERQIIDNFLHLMESRLRVLESSRIAMGSMVGVGIGCLVWLMFSERHEDIVSYSSLLVLFFGLRFVMNGIEGSMVTITAINRFLPHLLRLREMANQLDELHGWEAGPAPRLRRPATAIEAAAVRPPTLPAVAGGARPWRIDVPGLQRIDDEFRPGEVYALITAADSTVAIAQQLTQLIAAADGSADVAGVTPVNAAGVETQDRAWFDAVCAATRDGRATDAALADYLAGALVLARTPPALVVLDGTRLDALDGTGVLAVTELFAGSTVIVHSPDLDMLRTTVPSGELLLSDGQRIVALADAVSIRPQARAFIDAICDGRWREGRERYEAEATQMTPLRTLH